MTNKEAKQEKMQVILLAIVAIYFPLRLVVSYLFGI